MRPKKTTQARRVQIIVRIRIAMVMTVIRRPPEHAFLRGHGGDKGHDELKRAAGLERPVRKITMVSGGHKKHANVIHRQANDQIGPMKLQKEGRQTGQVDGKKWKGTHDRYAIATSQGYPT